MEFLIVQSLTGLASASELFLVAAGLSVIFGVSRVVNFAHGSFCMLGAYLAYTWVQFAATNLGGNSVVGFWLAVLGAAAAILSHAQAGSASMVRAWTRSASSSFNTSLISRCLWIRLVSRNAREVICTAKWVSPSACAPP